MSWFEQGTSKPRRVIMQFHRPAKLKLKRCFDLVECTRVPLWALGYFFIAFTAQINQGGVERWTKAVQAEVTLHAECVRAQ